MGDIWTWEGASSSGRTRTQIDFVFVSNTLDFNATLRPPYYKSDHKAITSLEWRSNRLVDALAKLAAADGAAPPSAAALLDSAEQEKQITQ